MKEKAIQPFFLSPSNISKSAPAFSWSSLAAPPMAVFPPSNSWCPPAWWWRELTGRMCEAADHTGQTASWECWGERHNSRTSPYVNQAGIDFYCVWRLIYNIHPFKRDRLSSKLVLSVWFGTLLRPSVTFTINCSTLLQEPVNKKQENRRNFKIFNWLLQPLVFPLLSKNMNLKRFAPHAFSIFQTKINTPCSSSRAMWTRALFLVLLISVCNLSWHALRLASVLADRPGSRSFSQYQALPCSNHTTTPSRARHSPMHSSAFPWQLWKPRNVQSEEESL